MPIEIIDLTNSPPSPPRSSSNAPMILNFGAVSENPIPNLHPIQTTLWPAASGYTYQTSQIATSWFQPVMHGAGRVTTVLEPVPESNTFLFPHGARLREPWTQREHELFLMGLIKFGRGRWSKIARHFLWNKTPQQVQSYAASFFRHLPATYLYGFRRRKPTNYSSANNHVTVNRNLMDGSASYSMPAVIANEPQQALPLFPEQAPFFQVPPYGGEANSSSTMSYGYGFQMLTDGESTSMTAASDSGEVDLELRLG